MDVDDLLTYFNILTCHVNKPYLITYVGRKHSYTVCVKLITFKLH